MEKVEKHLDRKLVCIFYLRGLCASFCIRKDTLLAKITKKNDNRLEKGLIGRQ